MSPVIGQIFIIDYTVVFATGQLFVGRKCQLVVGLWVQSSAQSWVGFLWLELWRRKSWPFACVRSLGSLSGLSSEAWQLVCSDELLCCLLLQLWFSAASEHCLLLYLEPHCLSLHICLLCPFPRCVTLNPRLQMVRGPCAWPAPRW